MAAEPHLATVSAQLGDALFLTVRTGLDTLCVARRIGSYPIQVLSIEVGVRRPLGVSSAGVAILAAMPAPEARKIVLANETRFGAYRTDTATVPGQIQLARRPGDAAEAQYDPGAVMVRIALGTGVSFAAIALTMRCPMPVERGSALALRPTPSSAIATTRSSPSGLSST